MNFSKRPKLCTFLSSAVLFSIICLTTCNGPKWTITAPKIIRPRAEYNIIVSLHDVPDVTYVSCNLIKRELGNLNNSKTSNDKKTFNKGNAIEIFKMQIDLEWTKGDYTLLVNGTGGVTFNEAIKIEFVYKQFVILVQSDKAIYKPGQNVLFRVVILDDTLRPIQPKEISDMEIFIVDPLDNKLQLFVLESNDHSLETDYFGVNKFHYIKGVTNDISFSLHREAMPGEWKILTQTHGQIQNYTFFVDYYQLPLANVTITVPQYVTFDKHNLDLQVDCFYTFGKPVKGMITIIFSKIRECGHDVVNSSQYIETFPIFGQYVNKFDLRDTRLLNPSCAEMSINVTVIVKDNITNNVYSNFEMFDVYKQDLRAELINKQKKFKPGHVIQSVIRIQQINGSSITKETMDNLNFVANITKKDGNSSSSIASNVNKDHERNQISCEFRTDEHSASLYYELQYKQIVLMNSTISSFLNCKKTFIQVLLQEPLKPLIVGEIANLFISSDENINQLIYYIVVRGSIVNASSIKYQNPNTDVILPIILTREMVPEVIVAVFFTSPKTGILASDAISLQVTGLFHNLVTFNVSTPMVDASQEAKFKIEAESDSVLFILGVDEAVLALKQGNDIIERRVLRELQYSVFDGDSASGFLQSGMELRTNADAECSSYYALKVVKDDDTVNQDDKTNRLRKDFRETWIWDNASIPHGKTSITLLSDVPDSITTWRLTAFAIHQEKGLGLTKLPGHVTVFRPFFLKLNLPYSIKRGETSEIHVLVFNYFNDNADINLSLKTDDENNISLKNCTFKLKMNLNDIQTLTCKVTGHNVGEFNVTASANAKSGDKKTSDGEIRQLLVIYEGIVKHMTRQVYFDLSKTETQDQQIIDKIAISFPKEAINGTQKVFASATAQLITYEWKDSLKTLISSNKITADFSSPHGCCEQRTIAYFPKVYLLDFLKASKKITNEIAQQAIDAIQLAVNMLCFQNPPDGSFVSWWYYYPYDEAHGGYFNNIVVPGTTSSSTWQTANTVKLLYRAKKYIDNVDKIIKSAVNWLKHKQTGGIYLEPDTRNPMKITENFEAYLTSFVYIALKSDPSFTNPTAEAYLAAIFPSLNDTYDKVIACYVLHLAKHMDRDRCYNAIFKLSTSDKIMRYWTRSGLEPNLQTTAYALMILIERNSFDSALETFRFVLSRQRADGSFSEDDGGIGSSLTTIICTEAMTQYITLLNSYDPKLESIFVDFNDGHSKQSLHIKPENPIIQSKELKNDTKEVIITASGFGRALARIYWEYNIVESFGRDFNVSATKSQINGDDAYINIDVCTSYNLDDKARNAILEVDLPTGYTFDKNGLNNSSELIDHIEATNSDTHVNVYLREVTKNQLCVSIPAIQSFKTDNTKPVPIKVYSYYNQKTLTVKQIVLN